MVTIITNTNKGAVGVGTVTVLVAVVRAETLIYIDTSITPSGQISAKPNQQSQL